MMKDSKIENLLNFYCVRNSLSTEYLYPPISLTTPITTLVELYYRCNSWQYLELNLNRRIVVVVLQSPIPAPLHPTDCTITIPFFTLLLPFSYSNTTHSIPPLLLLLPLLLPLEELLISCPGRVHPDHLSSLLLSIVPLHRAAPDGEV